LGRRLAASLKSAGFERVQGEVTMSIGNTDLT